MNKIRYIISIMLIILCSFVSADEDFSPYCFDISMSQKCFEDLPTAETLAKLPYPTIKDFEYLVNEDLNEATLYLLNNYYTEFVGYYINFIDLSLTTEEEDIIVEMFFSEDNDNINDNRRKFEEYMEGYDIFIDLDGDIKEYKEDGTIIANNGQFNIKSFGKIYDFRVNEVGELLIIDKTSGDWYNFEGVIKSDVYGNMRFEGEGTIRHYRMDEPLKLDNAHGIRFASDGDIIANAKTVGPLEFKSNTVVRYDPLQKTYSLKDGVLKDYPQYELTGKIGFEEGYILDTMYVPKGEKLDIRPTTSNKDHTPLENHVYTVKATGGKKVDIDLSNDDWIDDISEFIVGWWESDQEKDAVHFDESTHIPLVQSSKAKEGYDHSYTVDIDTGALYVAQKEADANELLNELPTRGWYKTGDYPKEGTKDRENIRVIQEIVGLEKDGLYGSNTKEAVIDWQNRYNQLKGFQPGDENYLYPTGAWGDAETIAYIAVSDNPTLSLKMGSEERGGAATVHLGEDGINLDLGGDVTFDIGDIRFFHDAEKGIDKKLAKGAGDDIELKVTIASIDENGEKIIELETSQGVYGLEDALVSGEITGQCTLALGIMDPTGANCAMYITELTKILGGGFVKYGDYDETFAAYLGIHGPAWEVSSNMRHEVRGGYSVWWKEQDGDMNFKDPLLEEQVEYDQSSFQEGDVITFYFRKSDFLQEAYEKGAEGRQATHIGMVVGKPRETFSVTDTVDPTNYIAEKLDVDTWFVPEYPIWINGKPVRYDDGKYYYVGEDNPITLYYGDKVTVEKTIISHLYHRGHEDPIRTEDYGHFLTYNTDFSLYEHIRPNPASLAEAAEIMADTEIIEIKTDKDLENILREKGIPETQLEYAVDLTKEINNLPASTTATGDVIRIPTQTRIRRQLEQDIVENLKINGIVNGNKIISAITTSTKERIQEYYAKEEDVNDIILTTVVLGMGESFWGESNIEEAEDKLWREAIAAETEQRTGVVPETVTYGYLQVSDENAQNNAEALGLNDYTEPTEMAALGEETYMVLEGSIKHGQREIVKNWVRYITPDMTYEEKLAIVAFAHHAGEDAPMIAAVQSQLNVEIDGFLFADDGSSKTLDALETFIKKEGVKLSKDERNKIKTGTLSLEDTAAYTTFKKLVKMQTGEEPPYTSIPLGNSYVRRTIKYCSLVTDVSGRCAYQVS